MFAYTGQHEPLHEGESQGFYEVRSARRLVCHVLEPGLQTPLPKKLTFRDEGKIRALARRGEAWQTSEDRQLLDYAIAKGEGGVHLRLTPEQYRALKPCHNI
jgi:hypothetical protein